MPAPQVPYAPPRLPQAPALAALEAELTLLQVRRPVRRFAGDAVPRALIEQALLIAGTAPSGAHRQPWYFVAIADPEKKRAIRVAAVISMPPANGTSCFSAIRTCWLTGAR